MNTAHGEVHDSGSRDASLRALAIVGFIALIACGIWLAIYSARYVPAAVDRVSSAAVALSGIFNRDNDSGDNGAVATSTPNTGGTTATSTTATSTPITHPGTSTGGTYPSGGTASTTAPYGLADLSASVLAVGYLAGPSTDTFVASSTVPSGMRPAFKFVIKNVGTNVMPANWRFTASLPNPSLALFTSQPQQLLNPGDSIEYTLGFDRSVNTGVEPVSVDANSDRFAGEASLANNVASASVTVLP